MTKRLAVIAVCFIVAAGVIGRASHSETVPLRAALATFPLHLAGWSGRDLPPFDPAVMQQLAVDDYINRAYVSVAGPVSLYIGMYKSQREGDTIHSPLNCLPGSGWEPVRKERVPIDVGLPQPIVVNQFLIQKGLDRQIVVYWYQSHGRVVASEYWGRAYLALDAFRLNRTDGSMVRVIVPIAGDANENDSAARAVAQQFTQQIFPLLSNYLPG